MSTEHRLRQAAQTEAQAWPATQTWSSSSIANSRRDRGWRQGNGVPRSTILTAGYIPIQGSVVPGGDVDVRNEQHYCGDRHITMIHTSRAALNISSQMLGSQLGKERRSRVTGRDVTLQRTPDPSRGWLVSNPAPPPPPPPSDHTTARPPLTDSCGAERALHIHIHWAHRNATLVLSVLVNAGGLSHTHPTLMISSSINCL